MSHTITARIRTSDGTEVSDTAQFPDDEWRQLERYASEAQILAANGILSKPGRLEYSLQRHEDGTSFAAVDMPNPDEFRSLLHQMRPFMLKDEQRTFFPHVRNVLARQLTHPAFQKYLELQKNIFAGCRCQSFRFVADGMLINSVETLDLWLNA